MRLRPAAVIMRADVDEGDIVAAIDRGGDFVAAFGGCFTGAAATVDCFFSRRFAGVSPPVCGFFRTGFFCAAAC
jgi:hypothetical protein